MAKASIEKYKSFEKWKFQEVENEFNIKIVSQNALLDDLITHQISFTDRETEQIDFLREKLLEMATSWNEYDMSIMFIGPLLNVVDLQNKAYRTFFNHTLKVTINNKIIQGRIDGMLAKGRQIPSVPLFFIQEYKPESGPNGDPLGQLLIEMVAAQALNKDMEQAIYGCYIVGRNWFFVVLHANEYAVSHAFDATQNDIYDIVAILKKVKILFEKKLNLI